MPEPSTTDSTSPRETWLTRLFPGLQEHDSIPVVPLMCGHGPVTISFSIRVRIEGTPHMVRWRIGCCSLSCATEVFGPTLNFLRHTMD